MANWRFQAHNLVILVLTLMQNGMFDTMTDGWVAVDDVSLTGPRVTKYYYLGSQRVAMRQGGVLTYLHGDHGHAQHGLQRQPCHGCQRRKSE